MQPVQTGQAASGNGNGSEPVATGAGLGSLSQSQEPLTLLTRLKRKFNAENMQIEVQNKAETELAQYTLLIKNANWSNVSGVEFWKANKGILKTLSGIGLDYCSAPASEAFCERVFSVCGDFCAKKRNRTSVYLEKRVFLKLNSRFFARNATASTISSSISTSKK